MIPTRYREAPLAASALLGLALALSACAPDLPPAWRIAPDPLDPATGQADPLGKLRLLAIAAEPPEAAPGAAVSLAALAVTHPISGQPGEDGLPGPRPRGLDALWLACRPAEGLAALDACGLGAPGTTTAQVELGAGPQATLPIAPDAAPGTLLVTLVVADEGRPGGARGCYEGAQEAGGIVQLPNRCVVGIKRVKVSAAGPRNENPGLRGLALGAPDPAGDAGRQLVLTRAPDAVEQEPDPDDASGATLRDEVLTAAFFATAGTLAAGRGGFAEPTCDAGDACPQIETSRVRRDPPDAGAAPLEAPGGRVYFFAVLRDDRGGLSFATLPVTIP